MHNLNNSSKNRVGWVLVPPQLLTTKEKQQKNVLQKIAIKTVSWSPLESPTDLSKDDNSYLSKSE